MFVWQALSEVNGLWPLSLQEEVVGGWQHKKNKASKQVKLNNVARSKEILPPHLCMYNIKTKELTGISSLILLEFPL